MSTQPSPSFAETPGDLAGVVGLHSADRDQGVGALRQGVRDEVLELAGLVAAEGDAAVEVLALGPEAGAAEVLGQPFEAVDRRRADQQLMAGDLGEGGEGVVHGVHSCRFARIRTIAANVPNLS